MTNFEPRIARRGVHPVQNIAMQEHTLHTYLYTIYSLGFKENKTIPSRPGQTSLPINSIMVRAMESSIHTDLQKQKNKKRTRFS